MRLLLDTRSVLLFLLTVCTISHQIFAEQFGVEQVAADQIEYQGTQIVLTGHVRVKLEVGLVTCGKGVLYVKKGSSLTTTGGVDKINLDGDVKLYFSDGDILEADRADLNCVTFEGVFYATSPNKVIYATAQRQNAKTGKIEPPMRASSDVLHAKIGQIAGKTGYQLTDLKGEGAVLIEYMRLETKVVPQSEPQPESHSSGSVDSSKEST